MPNYFEHSRGAAYLRVSAKVVQVENRTKEFILFYVETQPTGLAHSTTKPTGRSYGHAKARPYIANTIQIICIISRQFQWVWRAIRFLASLASNPIKEWEFNG